tara:strand:- start:128 stop:739 length:612 start_codon:yes stop_codon:yes gene_type:complete
MIKTGCFLDGFIDGYKEEITSIYGKAATGKTTLAKLASIEAAKQGKVVFIDSEGSFSVERFEQLGGKDFLKNLIIFNPKDFKDQTSIIENVSKLDIKLVIVDTIGVYYRVESKKDARNANILLDRQLKILSELARNNVHILLINQVYTNIDTNKVNIVGGNMMRNWSKLIIRLDKDPRKMAIEKPFSQEFGFNIINEGLVKIE